MQVALPVQIVVFFGKLKNGKKEAPCSLAACAILLFPKSPGSRLQSDG